MNAEEFYREGMRPERMGFVVRPLRRLVYRLLRPYLLVLLRIANAGGAENEPATFRQLDIQQRAIAESVGDMTTQLAAVQQRLELIAERLARYQERQEEIDAKLRSISALTWDREAVVRRLAMLEDLLARELPGTSGSDQTSDANASATTEAPPGGG
jgi:DNA repair ATPase RecN